MMVGKEAVTALLGLLVIASTLLAADRTLGMAGDEDRMRDGMAVVTLLVGLAGVVIGYYFGRIPSDARAAQAQERMTEAVAAQSHAAAMINNAAVKTRAIRNSMHQKMAIAEMLPRTPNEPETERSEFMATTLHQVMQDFDEGLDELSSMFLIPTPMQSRSAQS
jgi:hypothetical protein